WGSSARVGASTDSPPMPESKKRMGEFASIQAGASHGAGVAGNRREDEDCAAVPVCYHRRMTREMIFALALGYLLGSIPFGLVLTRLAGKGDVREIGSGNIGATNVLRTGSRVLAALTLILDCLKATAAVLVAQRVLGPETGLAAAAGALIGHLYPV